MKVVEVNAFHYPYMGGIEHRIHHQSQRLGKKHKVTVLTSRLPDTPERERMDNYDVVRLDSRFVNFYNPPHVITPGILEAIEELDPDIVDFHYRWSGTYNKAARSYRGAKTFTFHNTFGEGVGLLRPFSLLNDALWKPHLLKFEKIICVSEFVRKDLISRGFGPDQLEVVSSCIEMPLPREQREEDYILFVGRLVATKGIPYILHAMREVDTRLVICGDGPSRHSLERMAAKLGVEKKVRFEGRVSEERKADLFAGCKMLVMPSLFESLGLAAAEAMSYGKPVIASTSGGLPEVVGKGGLVVPPRDSKKLAEAIRSLLEDEELRHSLGAKAKEIAAQYSWDLEVERIESIYSSLVSGSK
ncbi:MAG TPA: glycosyltransferase family 4 protein [Methanomassiliicoccales archaeon]|jgi:glycosyltransferase involved in cell wall biosynthesis